MRPARPSRYQNKKKKYCLETILKPILGGFHQPEPQARESGIGDCDPLSSIPRCRVELVWVLKLFCPVEDKHMVFHSGVFHSG